MRKLPWLLLAVSIALNISVIAAVLYTDYEARRLEDPEVRLAEVGEALSLTPAQFESFKDLQTSLQERRQMFREYMAPVRRSMTEALVADAFEREAYRTVISKRREVREEYFLQVGEEMNAFLQTLSPEQRAVFRDLAKERGFLWRFMGGRSRLRSAAAAQ
ncbi:MAG: Spy/CpxP family protein refolding chaperone [Kiloniellales bacterium]|nr:Spy/CpxP family protein refolding chaperone [Kiloniellales bacterium]